MHWRQVLAQALSKKPNPEAAREIPMSGGIEPLVSFSGYEPKKLFMRRDEGRFDDCAWVEGFDSRLDGRSLVTADLDGDGDLDLVMTNRNEPRIQLFENVGAPGNAFELALESTRGHREADGAVALVEGLGAFPVVLNRGYASAVDPAVHVGLGPKKEARVRVRWRSGVTEDFGLVRAGARYRLREGTKKVERLRAFGATREVKALPYPSTAAALTGLTPGRPAVVQLFMESCKPCRAEVPQLNARAKKGLLVVGLGLHDAEALPGVKARLKMAYDVAPLPEAVAAAFETKGELVLPTVLVYGADGALVRVVAGAEQLTAVLEELGLTPK